MPASAHAVPPVTVTVAVDDLVYFGLGETSFKPTQNGGRLVTTGLQGVGTLNCNGDLDCVDAGLDGRQLFLLQDLQILIDVTIAGVIQETLGRLARAGDQCDWGPFRLKVLEAPERGHLLVEMALTQRKEDPT